MNKFIFLIFIFSVAFAAESPFSRIRITAYDSDGMPSEEVHDVSICLERNPTAEEKRNYEEVIGYYADGLCKTGRWPGANGGILLGWGGIGVSDEWVLNGSVFPKMNDVKSSE